MRRLAVVAFVLTLLAAAPAAADAPEDKGFGLRFTSALSRFSRCPDLAGLGGAGGGSLVVRPDLYTFLTRNLTLYAEYVFSRFSDGTGTLVNHRGAVGLDLTITRGIYARAGAVPDRWGNLSGTVGLGVNPSERVMIDLSWQVNMFPEIEPEFGRGDTLGLGLTVLF